MKRLFYLTTLASIAMISCAEPNDEPKRIKTYPISISAQQTSDGTRVENIEGIDHWSVGDKIGLYVFSGGTMDALGIQVGDLYVDYTQDDWGSNITSLLDNNGFSHSVIANFAMTGLHTEPSPTTDFQGALTFEQISSLDPNGLYDYFTYYPYININEPTIMLMSLFTPESEITVRSNVFPAHTVRLFGTLHANSAPITWLDENQEQQWGAKKIFNYGHTMSYLRLRLAGNSVNPDVPVVGISLNLPALVFSIDEQGEVQVVGMSSYIRINVEDGMNVGDHIFIPINPHRSPGHLTFEFTFADGSTWSKNIQGRTAEQGKIHNISFNLQ